MASTPISEPVSGAPDVPAGGTRLHSLDAFRGITIAGMLLVNNPGTWGAIYPPLKHAPWNGWTPTDLIFPFFIFIVGVSMTYSFGKMLERGATERDLLLKTAKRAVLIFLVGLALHSFPWVGYDFSTIRIPGVLQRIAIAYFFAAAIYLHTRMRGQIIAIAALLLGYWAIQSLVPVPGGFTGALRPGLDFGAYIDRMVFGSAHVWKEAKTWDPEGLLSTMPAIGTALLGGLAGTWIRSQRSGLEKVAGLFVVGTAGIVAGVIWGWVFPINKPLWTSSYVLFTAGMACHFLAICYYLIDLKGIRRWSKPFIIFGTNAIAAFFLSGAGARVLNMIKVAGPDGGPVALKTWLFQNFYLSWATPINASLAFAITYVLFWLGIMTILYKKQIFIKL